MQEKKYLDSTGVELLKQYVDEETELDYASDSDIANIITGEEGDIPLDTKGFAGGAGASIIDESGNRIEAIQLGSGVNMEENTLKVYDYKLLNADGTIPRERLQDTLNSLYYYDDINIIPSDNSLFEFTVDTETMTASIRSKDETISGDIVIPYAYESNGEIYRVTTMDTNAFVACSLTSVIIPNSVTNIAASAFELCKELTSVIIPNSVTRINDSAFRDCVKLTNINIPNSITSIDGSAFSGCYDLINVIIPNNVIFIGDGAFNSCTSLTSITIPNSVTNIGEVVFGGCDNLTDVYFKGTKEQWESIEIHERGNDVLSTVKIHYNWCDGNSGSSTEPFYVNFSVAQTDDLGNISKLQSDKTASEIREAVEEGKNIIAGFVLPDSNNTYLSPKLEGYDKSSMTFTLDIRDIKYTVYSKISDDTGLWEIYSTINITVQEADDFIDAYGHRVTNLLDPRETNDATTKGYVDGIVDNKVGTGEYERFKSNLESGEFEVEWARNAHSADSSNHSNYARYDLDGNDISETYAKIRPDVITDIPDTLSPNTSYNFGEVESLHISFPIIATDGDVIYLTFMVKGENTDIAIEFTNASDIDIEIMPNTGYEIYAKYNGSIWIVGYSEYTVTDGESQ